MMKGKPMILEQGAGWDKAGRAVTSKLGSMVDGERDPWSAQELLALAKLVLRSG
jgi:hypothetical protein